MQAAQEHIDGAAQVLVGIIIRQAVFQQAVQGQQVEYVLHFVAFFQHGVSHGIQGVGAVIHAQPVRFVVEHVVFAVVFEYQIDKALEHAVEGIGFQSRARMLWMDMLADQGVHLSHFHLVGREQEFQFRHIGVQGIEGDLVVFQRQASGDCLLPPVADHFHKILPAPGLQFFFHAGFKLGGVGQGLREALVGGLLEHIVEQGARCGATGEGVDGIRQRFGVIDNGVVLLLGQLIAARVRRGQGFLYLFKRTVAGNPPGLPLSCHRNQRRAQSPRLRFGLIAFRVAVWRVDDGDRIMGHRCQCGTQAVVGYAIAEQQTADGAFLQLVLFAAALDVGCDSQGAGMASASQGHVEQTHVFGEPFVVRLVFHRLVRFQRHIEMIVFVVTQRRLALVRRAEAADKGQVHQRVFQTLGFVDGDDFDPVVVTFQAQDTFLAIAATFLNRIF